MSLLTAAIKQFQAQNYGAALELFERAGRVYGEHVVQINVKHCRARLRAITQVAAPQFVSVAAPLDPATRLMLAQAGSVSLTDAEKQGLLEAFKKATGRRSPDAEVKPVNPRPSDWPSDILLAPLPESTNDYVWHARHRRHGSTAPREIGLSIVVPTFNRSKIVDVTLACLVNQKTTHPFEVIVADDGSREEITQVTRKYESKLDVKYVRQKDYGYQLCAVRNLGLRTARYEFVAILDCDMAPNPRWVQSYIDVLLENDDVALIGPRKYVDTSCHSADDFLRRPEMLESLPEVITNNSVAGQVENQVSVDWRISHFKKTDNLRLCDSPFRYFSGGNVAFAKKWLTKAGWFDEEFTHWGGEDNEFGYRLYRSGCYFRAVDGGMAYHQEPPGKENETDRDQGKKVTAALVQEKVPYWYRKRTAVSEARLQRVPLVSIYIPAYNCAQSIVRCIDSALNQTTVDLEVCVCNDGSTDDTLKVLRDHYGEHPRVTIIDKPNGGIGSASNAAVRACRGFYVGQLDSDDYLEPDAVELCLAEFFRDRKLACVYTTNRNVKPDGTLIANGYNWPVYSREKLTTTMIAHHFRMFTMRAWNLTAGFDESIANAVDYDMYLKLSEVGPFKHLNKICYNRVLHGENTSIKKLGAQKQNHFKVINKSLERQKVASVQLIAVNEQDDACRKYVFKKKL